MSQSRSSRHDDAAVSMASQLAGRRKRHTLPREFYADPAFFDLDRRAILESRWIHAGLECEIPRAGQFFTVTIGTSSVIVCLDRDMAIRAFFNACRHSGSIVADAERGECQGVVHEDAVEGRDYDLERLVHVWRETNDQDRRLVERNQRGVNSLGYQPGPYAEASEHGVWTVVEWYGDTMQAYLGRADQPTVASRPGSSAARTTA